MKNVLVTAAAVLAILVPSAARPATMDAATFGAGLHGYDYQIGTWTCTNPAPSAISGPAHQTMTVTKVSDGVLLFHTTGTNYDFTGYNIYVPAKNMWMNPYSGSDGTYGNESTSQAGSKTVWIGSTYFPKMGKMVPTRDTYLNSWNRYTDLGEYRLNGVWKTQYDETCTKA